MTSFMVRSYQLLLTSIEQHMLPIRKLCVRKEPLSNEFGDFFSVLASLKPHLLWNILNSALNGSLWKGYLTNKAEFSILIQLCNGEKALFKVSISRHVVIADSPRQTIFIRFLCLRSQLHTNCMAHLLNTSSLFWRVLQLGLLQKHMQNQVSRLF